MAVNLESRIRGTLWSHITEDFFTHSAHFPLANIFLEMLLTSPWSYFRDADLYLILSASLAQSALAGWWRHGGRPRPLLANLSGPALYTLVEMLMDGWGFFEKPHHLAYWAFALSIGLVQEARIRMPALAAAWWIILENFFRTSILLVMYAILEILLDPKNNSVSVFLEDRSHVFVVLVVPLLGVLLGVANSNAIRYQDLLRRTASQLRGYSEWLLGRELLSQAVEHPEALSLRRRERTIVFADIRGFTHWSEKNSPETVVGMLNRFFATAETVLNRHHAIRVQMIGDEVMTAFPGIREAVAGALTLSQALRPVLSRDALAVGIGVHHGPVVEGLVGGQEVKAYNLVGDTVNTAKRICDTAAPWEVLVSESIYQELNPKWLGPKRQITVKGKTEALQVCAMRMPSPKASK
ncbi:MAG: adenylate/guanylate cyclase domain-containing protein [Deltaproteobacteria bacterium]|nr:adenylate/guanylate cyclase domain-containing protein [Deltaproteobacteria bacterium]